jgi:hypothetical protein
VEPQVARPQLLDRLAAKATAAGTSVVVNWVRLPHLHELLTDTDTKRASTGKEIYPLRSDVIASAQNWTTQDLLLCALRVDEELA